jgi:hypothetical protein
MQPQVGLRGPNNTFAPNVNDRRVGNGAETWATPLPGTWSDNTCRSTGTAPARSWTEGRTYRWGSCKLPAGTACNDGDPNTMLDALDGNCNCTVVICSEDVTLEFYTDEYLGAMSWAIEDILSETVLASGQGNVLPPDAMFQIVYFLPADRCCKFHVVDDGMGPPGNPGYQLRYTANQKRIIDNKDNFAAGVSVSEMSNAYSFCLPFGTDEPINTSCDKLW